MSEKDIEIMIELLEIFANSDEETRAKILENAQILIEKPDRPNQVS